MAKYLVKRFLVYVITLPLLVYMIMMLVNLSPNDPVERLMSMGDFVPDADVYEALYQSTAKKHHLDLPLFYWSFKSNNYSQYYFATFHTKRDLNLAKKFLDRGTLEKLTFDFIKEIHVIQSNKSLPLEQKQYLSQLYDVSNPMLYKQFINDLDTEVFGSIKRTYHKMLANRNLKNKWPPKIIWHGSECRFHQYFSSLVRLDFGRSYTNNQAIGPRIWEALQYTLFFVLLGNIITIPIAIWWGKFSANHSSNWFVKIVENIFYLFYAIPLFWLATMLLVFFTTDEYGAWTNLFEIPQAYLFSQDQSPFANSVQYASRFVLPIICLFLHDIAIFTRQVKNLLQDETKKPYLLTALMKGLSFNQASNKHAFRNTKVQLITMISGGLVAFFRGSLVLEIIFNIPGLGRLTFDSVKQVDIPVLIGIVVFTFTITTIIFLITDLLYLKFNPKLKKI